MIRASPGPSGPASVEPACVAVPPHGLPAPADPRRRARRQLLGRHPAQHLQRPVLGRRRPQHGFYQYYAGGHDWNLGLDPYLNYPDDPRVIHPPRMNYPQISGYIYPPTVLPLLSQLARYDYEWARTAWVALDVAVFSLMMLVAVVVSRGRRLEVLTAAVLLTMVSFAFFYHIHEGQIDMIVAGLSISAFLLYPRWGGWPSAALLAIAVATKVTPIPVSYTHLRAHETRHDLVCRLLLE